MSTAEAARRGGQQNWAQGHRRSGVVGSTLNWRRALLGTAIDKKMVLKRYRDAVCLEQLKTTVSTRTRDGEGSENHTVWREGGGGGI